MPAPPKNLQHKFGANRKETTRKPRKSGDNFSQSKDIREDRGERQMKTERNRQTMPHQVPTK